MLLFLSLNGLLKLVMAFSDPDQTSLKTRTNWNSHCCCYMRVFRLQQKISVEGHIDFRDQKVGTTSPEKVLGFRLVGAPLSSARWIIYMLQKQLLASSRELRLRCSVLLCCLSGLDYVNISMLGDASTVFLLLSVSARQRWLQTACDWWRSALNVVLVKTNLMLYLVNSFVQRNRGSPITHSNVVDYSVRSGKSASR